MNDITVILILGQAVMNILIVGSPVHVTVRAWLTAGGIM